MVPWLSSGAHLPLIGAHSVWMLGISQAQKEYFHFLGKMKNENNYWLVGSLSPDPLIHAKGSATLLLQLGRKAHLHAPTRDEDFSAIHQRESAIDKCLS